MLAIRLQRVGKRNNPAFRVVLMDARRSAKSGDSLEILGSHNPRRKGSLSIKKDRISHWLSKGAQPSDTIHNLLVDEKIIHAPKRNVVAPSKLKKSGPEKVSTEASSEVVAAALQGEASLAPEVQQEKVEETEKPTDTDPTVADALTEKKEDVGG